MSVTSALVERIFLQSGHTRPECHPNFWRCWCFLSVIVDNMFTLWALCWLVCLEKNDVQQTLEVDLILWVANFRPCVRLSTKSFFDFDEIWYTGSTRWEMKNVMTMPGSKVKVRSPWKSEIRPFSNSISSPISVKYMEIVSFSANSKFMANFFSLLHYEPKWMYHSDENKVICIAKCDVFLGACESIWYSRAFRCESLYAVYTETAASYLSACRAAVGLYSCTVAWLHVRNYQHTTDYSVVTLCLRIQNCVAYIIFC